MNHTTKRSIRTVAWTALLLTLTVLALTCTMTLGIAAADGDTYTLKLAATLYDENGEEWPVGIQTELSEGDTIDTDALFAQLVTHYPHLAGTTLSDEGFVGLPADGKMPAQDLTLSATYEVRPFTVTWIVDGAATEQKVAYGKVPAFSGSTDKVLLCATIIVGYTTAQTIQTEISLNEWCHCVYTYNGSDYAALYVNGVLVGELTLNVAMSMPQFTTVIPHISIGANAENINGLSANGMTGSIAICNIYSVPTDAENAVAMWNAVSPAAQALDSGAN